MNKKTNNNNIIPASIIALGFMFGVICGIVFTLYGVGFLLEQIHIDKIDISFNETKLVDYMFEKVKETPGIWVDYNNSETGYHYIDWNGIFTMDVGNGR